MKPEGEKRYKVVKNTFSEMVFFFNSSYFLMTFRYPSNLRILCVCSHMHGESITQKWNFHNTGNVSYELISSRLTDTLFSKFLWSTKTPWNGCLLGPDHSSYFDITVQHLSEKNSIKALDQERNMSYQLCTGSFWQCFHLYMHFNQF